MKSGIIFLLGTLLIGLSGFSSEPHHARVYIFLSADCPCAFSHQETVRLLERKYSPLIEFTAVFVNKSDDAEEIGAMMKNLGWKMNCIRDQDKRLFKKYHPKVYTDCVLVSSAGHVLYHGAIDDSPVNMGQVKNSYLQSAIEDFLHNRPVQVSYGKGVGCLIVK